MVDKSANSIVVCNLGTKPIQKMYERVLIEGSQDAILLSTECPQTPKTIEITYC
jgi:hypothetical protein